MKVIFISDCSKCPHMASALGGILCRNNDNREIDPIDNPSFRDEREAYCPTPEWCALDAIDDDNALSDLFETYLKAVMFSTPPQPE